MLAAGSHSSPRAAGLSKCFSDLLGQMLMGMGKQSVFPVLNNLVCIWGKGRQGWEECEHGTWVIIGEEDDDADFDINKRRARIVKRGENSIQFLITTSLLFLSETHITCSTTDDFLTSQVFRCSLRTTTLFPGDFLL